MPAGRRLWRMPLVDPLDIVLHGVKQWICGCSLFSLPKKNESLFPWTGSAISRFCTCFLLYEFQYSWLNFPQIRSRCIVQAIDQL